MSMSLVALRTNAVTLVSVVAPLSPDSLLERELITNLSANGANLYSSWAIH